MNKLMLALAVGAAALAAVWAVGAAEADEDRFRFADCSVEFILQDGRFVAVDGRSWLEVDPGGECRETAEDDESSADDEGAGSEGDDSPADDEGAEGEGDDSSADGGGEGSDDSRSAPAGSASAEANQQDDGEDGAGSADGSSGPPPLPASVVDEIARWAQEQPSGAPPPCTDAVKPATGPTLISFRDDRHCVIVRYAGVVQLSRGDYTLNVTLPPAVTPPGILGWEVSSLVHGLIGTSFLFDHPSIGYIRLNAADGAEMNRQDHTCIREGNVLFDILIARDGAYTHSIPGVTVVCAPVAPGFPAMFDAIAASATVPAAE